MDLTPVAEVLGEDVVVGCPALSRSFALQLAAEAEALTGRKGIFATATADEDPANAPIVSDPLSPGGHNGTIFIACGARAIAFFVHHPGFFLASTGLLLALHDHADIASCEFRPARTGESRIIFRLYSGTTYELEVQMPQRGKAHRIEEIFERRAIAA